MTTCRRCSCYKNIYNVNCISYSSESDIPVDILLLGEMAGREEAKISNEKPSHFIGKAGEILNKVKDPIKNYKVAIVNSHRCYKESNKTPVKSELDACFVHLVRDISVLKPKIVVALGATALYQAVGASSSEFSFYRGRLIFSDKINCNVFTTHHPAAIIYSPSKLEELIEDFKKIPDLIGKNTSIKHYNYEVVDTSNKLKEVISLIGKDKDIKFDIETDGLSSYDKSLDFRSIQFGVDENKIYIVNKKVVYECKEQLKELFENNYVSGHDFAFDVKWLYNRLGIFPDKWNFDSCLAEYLISGMKNNDLAFLTGKYNAEAYNYWKEVDDAGGPHKVKDKKVLYQYGSDDIGTMFPIHKRQNKSLMKDGMSHLFTDIWMPCNKVLTKMSLRGVKVDLDYLLDLDKKYEKRAQKILNQAFTLESVSECEKHFNKPFNPRSSQHLRWLFFDYYKLPVLQRTKPSKSFPEGSPSTSQDEMSIYAEKHNNEYCKIMEKYRSLQTVRDNFLSGVVPKLIDGVAHTTYSLHATTTGRPNSKDPNLLNFPSKKEYKDVKGCIVSRDGYTFVAADMAQAEMRVASVIYDDEKLIELCNDKDKNDFHSIITARVYGKTYEYIKEGYDNGDKEITEWRRICKAISFGILYQQGPEALAYALGISVEKAKQFIRDYFIGFPDLQRNIELQKKFVVENGYVQTYFGFRRYFKNHTWEDHKTLRDAVNTPIQGTAWNMMQLCLINVDKKLRDMNIDGALVLQIYDQLIAEVKDEYVDMVCPMIKDVMENSHNKYESLNRVSMKTDVETGKRLNELKKVKI